METIKPEYSGSPREVVHIFRQELHDFGQNISTEIRRSSFDKTVLCPNSGKN